MKSADTIIEILDEKSVRVYLHDSVITVGDDKLPQRVGKRIVMTDPVHVLHARLPMILQKKQIQPEVLASLVEDNLTSDRNTFHFNAKVVNDYTDVTWISKKRVCELEERFASIQTSLIGIIPTALLMTVERIDTVVHHSPWHYATIEQEGLTETMSLSDNLLSVWQQTTDKQLTEFDFSSPNTLFLGLNSVPIVPFLKQKIKSKPARSIAPLWFTACVFLLLVMTLWSVNTYIALQHDEANLKEVKQAQTIVLKQLFPNTKNTSDPYGRILSEANSLGGILFFETVDNILSQSKIELLTVTADLKARKVTLTSSQPFDELKNTLIKKGLQVNEEEGTLIVEENNE